MKTIPLCHVLLLAGGALVGAIAQPPDPSRPLRVVFGDPQTEFRWSRSELSPELPADWSGYNYLVLELRVSSPQRFALQLHSGNRVQSRQILPFPNVWIRAAVPLQFFRQPKGTGHDLASIGKVAGNSFLMGTEGAYGPLDAVTAIGLSMRKPVGQPAVELRSITLAKTDPGSDVLDRKPVVDEFGQWIPEDWPGKVANLDQLRREWAAESAALRPGDYGWCRYGGYRNTSARATGFFRVEQVDGRWWFVDPDGHHFFSTGVTCMIDHGNEARLQGRENYFAALPPPSASGGRANTPSFHTWNLERRHGKDRRARWRELTADRCDDWGLNTIGNWSDRQLWAIGRKAYQVDLSGWGMRTGYLGLPDVYAEEFPAVADRDAAQQCAPRRNDPWLLGYFIANEPPWPSHESLVVDLILRGKPSAIQREAKAFLAAGDTLPRRRQFVYRAFERFVEVTVAAIRRHDPNHLILGLRFGEAGRMPEEMIRACRVFDVYSLNVYANAVDSEKVEQINRLTGRPVLVGEFHFGVPGRGLAAGMVPVRDAAERGTAYRHSVEQTAAAPALIGVSWFQWVDLPPTGRMDGANANVGLVDVTDRPYPDMIEALRITCRRLQGVHSGALAPFAAPARPPES